jgi:hypothetical protein
MDEECPLGGNTDLYGLGVRLGIYFQLFATIIANHGLAVALQSAVDTNMIFLLAIFVAIIKSTAESQLATIEAFILLQIMLAFLLSVVKIDGLRWIFLAINTVASHKKHDLAEAHFKVSTFGMYWRQCIGTATVAYYVWFWSTGGSNLEGANPCNFQVFFFRRWNGFGRIHYFFRAAGFLFILLTIQNWIITLFWVEENLAIGGVDSGTARADFPDDGKFKRCLTIDNKSPLIRTSKVILRGFKPLNRTASRLVADLIL